MRPQELAKLQRDFLIQTEKQSAILLDAEFEQLKREIAADLMRNLSPQTRTAVENFLSEVLRLLSEKYDNMAARSAKIVGRAQSRVINFASRSLQEFLPQVKTSIFSPDREAIRGLVGRTQTDKSLTSFFQRFKPVVAERAKQTLIEAFSAGESDQEIARRLGSVTDTEKFMFLTVSRTETNEAYRAASREFYDAADIRQYVWLAVLDARTCLICWFLHGRKFNSKKKIFSHVNCRCSIVPVIKGQKTIKTGIEHFIELEKGYKKQILGNSRLELFEKGMPFESFVGIKESEEFGKSYFIKPLADFEV